MTESQYQAAQQKVQKMAELTMPLNALRDISKEGIGRMMIEPHRGENLDLRGGGEAAYRKISNQPESVQVIIKAFVSTLISAYQSELDKLEKEFEQI